MFIRHFWELIDRGGTLICVDPRENTLARVAQLHVPVRPGADAALLNAMLHVIVAEDLVDRAFVDAHTVGFDAAAAAVAEGHPDAHHRSVVYRPTTSCPPHGCTDAAMLNHARGLEHHVMGTRNSQATINLCLATGNLGRPDAGYGTITGQGNGQGGREHGQKCDQPPGSASSMTRARSSTPRRCGGSIRPRFP